ncbi:MAG: oligopeptide ABC transporter permease OppB [Gammaproteobacteria bacterium]|nr:oligopeptide ABC transporter permease OppB [Gammaproteobacteria bacterium]
MVARLFDSYLLRRLLGTVPTLLVLVTIAFFLVRFAPGGPFDYERALPPEIEANLLAQYHLDEPLWKQYFRYLGDLLQGDLGPSFQYRDYRVSELIAAGLPVSMLLGGLSVLLALVLGVLAGMVAGLKQGRAADNTVMALAMTGISIPNFVLAPVLVLLLAVWLGWLPAGGWNGGAPANLVMPVIALALPQLAYIARLTRSSLLDVMSSDFIRTARAKGLPDSVILRRHALKPVLLPVISYLGPAAAAVMTGSVVIEQIFGIPGVGRFFVHGALNRDYTLVLGVVIFYGLIVVLFNLLVDLCYAWLDPRVRLR